MGQRYTIVASDRDGDRPLDAEVHIRTYRDVKCNCCGAQLGASGYDARLDAAYNDGLALGRMLRKHGVPEYQRGLDDGLKGA